MTSSHLRVLVDNLDEYIHIPGGIDRLKKTVLSMAIEGSLTTQHESATNASQVIDKIKAEINKNPKNRKVKDLAQSRTNLQHKIPSSWTWVKLGEIMFVTKLAGFEYSKYLAPKDSGEVPLVRAKNVKSSGLYDQDLKYIDLEVSLALERSALNKPCLLTNFVGSIGEMCLFDKTERWHMGPNVAKIEPYENTEDLINLKYLKYFFNSTIGQAELFKHMKATAQPSISMGTLRDADIAFPPLEEQQQIVDKLDTVFNLVDDLNDKYRAEEFERARLVRSSLRAFSHDKSLVALTNITHMIKTKSDATQLRNAILHLAVSGQLVPQIAGEGTSEELYKHIRALNHRSMAKVDEIEKPFVIPQSWKWMRLGEVTEMQNGFAFKSSQWGTEGLPIVRIQNLNNKNASHNYADPNAVDKKYRITDGQVLLSWSGTPGTSFGVFVWEGGEALLNQHIFKCNVHLLDKEYYRITANEAIYKKLDTAHGGVGLKHMTKSQLEALPLSIPPIAEQKRIVKRTSELLDLVAELEKNLEN